MKRKDWHLFLPVFQLLLPKPNFFKGDWALGCVSTQIWEFSNIYELPKILGLNSFGILWGNSYSKLAILDIKFHFTCVESDLSENMVKFQRIISRIVVNLDGDNYSCFTWISVHDLMSLVLIYQSNSKYQKNF